jgi:hypothetical protein
MSQICEVWRWRSGNGTVSPLPTNKTYVAYGSDLTITWAPASGETTLWAEVSDYDQFNWINLDPALGTYTFHNIGVGHEDDPVHGHIVCVYIAFSGSDHPTHTLTYLADNGTILGNAAQIVDDGEDGTPVEAIADAGYTFDKWDDDLATPTRCDVDVHANHTFTALFISAGFTLTYIKGDHGSITGVLVQEVEQGADGTEVTAVPDEHYYFLKWDDNDSIVAVRQDLDVQADITATALFAPLWILTYSADANGEVSGDSPQYVADGEDGTPVEAIPDTGYSFRYWTRDAVINGTQNPRTDTNVHEDRDIIAYFTLKACVKKVLQWVFRFQLTHKKV